MAPWLFISIFAGMGSPPTIAASWVATATEQQKGLFLAWVNSYFFGNASAFAQYDLLG